MRWYAVNLETASRLHCTIHRTVIDLHDSQNENPLSQNTSSHDAAWAAIWRMHAALEMKRGGAKLWVGFLCWEPWWQSRWVFFAKIGRIKKFLNAIHHIINVYLHRHYMHSTFRVTSHGQKTIQQSHTTKHKRQKNNKLAKCAACIGSAAAAVGILVQRCCIRSSYVSLMKLHKPLSIRIISYE